MDPPDSKHPLPPVQDKNMNERTNLRQKAVDVSELMFELQERGVDGKGDPKTHGG